MSHGGFTQLLSYIELLRTARNHPARFDYVHMMSAQDYPIRSNAQFDDFFEHTTHTFAYLDQEELVRQLSGQWNAYLNEWHFENHRAWYARVYEKLRLGKLVSVFFPRKPIEDAHSGWDWFSWNRRTLDFVITYIETHPEYLKRYRHTLASVENCFNTLLWRNREELEVEDHNPLRYISWHPHRPVDTDYRPFVFNELDYEFIIDSKAFFCRKVDADLSAKLLDMIDAQRGAPYNIDEHEYYI